MKNSLSQLPNKHDLVKSTLVLILAGGRGSRLHELTDKRAKPALYFGGNRRIIDFALSNCINSGLNRIGVVTQYAAHSLLRHLQKGWSFLPQERGEFIDMLPARQMLLDHVTSGAKCTVGCIEVPRSEAHEFGVMAVNENLKVKAFVEKPKDPPAMVGKPDTSLASMGIYVFNADYLYEMLNKEVNTPYTSHDFGKDVLPKCLEEGTLYAHPFSRSCMGRNTEGDIYWRDVGTLDSFWQSNIDLVSEHPQLDIYDQTWPIRGNPVQAYPSKFFYKNTNVKPVDNSLIGGGCVITDASISYSVLFDRIKIEEGSVIDHSVVLPEVKIGKNCVLKHCIIDRHCVIPDGMQIGVDRELDSKRFRISSTGKVILVTPSMLKKLEGQEVFSEEHLD